MLTPRWAATLHAPGPRRAVAGRFGQRHADYNAPREARVQQARLDPVPPRCQPYSIVSRATATEAMTQRTPIVFLPGLLNDAALWSHQVDGLADIAAPQVVETTRHDTVAEIAAAALSEAPDRFALAGLSMGGYVAFEMLRQQPERVARLALINTRATLDSAAEARRRRGLIQLARRGRFKGVTPRLMPTLLAEANLADAKLTGTVTGMAERVGRDGFIRQQTAIMHRPDSRPLLPAIAQPTLVVGGRDDTLTPPAEQHHMAEHIPGADLVILARAGHLSPLERPEAVTNALRGWLMA